MALFIGLISGTSMDGIDAAIVSFDNTSIEVIGALTFEYPAQVRERLARVTVPDAVVPVHEIGSLHVTVGRAFADAANAVLHQSGLTRQRITAIGSHGQTIRHSPESDPPYSLQIGDPATIAVRCALPTVADFRSLDIADGGHGAPLVPAFHDQVFRRQDADTVVVNIGGIANASILPADPDAPIAGFDTGPGNCLLDEWIADVRGQPFDAAGAWAASGAAAPRLLSLLMGDPYIKREQARSTGREYFNLAWLRRCLRQLGEAQPDPADVQATLAEFTAASIASGITRSGIDPDQVLVCGGGALNVDLMQRLARHLPSSSVESTGTIGIDPGMVEAAAFAWLARQRMESKPVRMTTAGGRRERVLGAVYLPTAA